MARSLQATLTRKVGPFPVWAWGLIIVAGVMLARQVGGPFGKQAGQRRTQRGEPETDLFVPYPPSGGAVAGGPDASVPFQPGPSAPETNEEWIRSAVNTLREKYRAVDVDTALRRYTQGLTLSAAQGVIVSEAIAVAGTPPEGAPPAQIEKPPSSPVPQPPPPKAPAPAPPPRPGPAPAPPKRTNCAPAARVYNMIQGNRIQPPVPVPFRYYVRIIPANADYAITGGGQLREATRLWGPALPTVAKPSNLRGELVQWAGGPGRLEALNRC